MTLFKSRVLGFIEYRTPAIYHGSATSLDQIDAVHRRLLNALSISKEESLLEYRLAPLGTRRDIGMLGVIHRSVIGEGPSQFSKFFVRTAAGSHTTGRENKRRHDKQLTTHRRGKFLDVMAHSILGLIDIYNLLPQSVVNATTLPDFQHKLQLLVVEMATRQQEGWEQVFSLRNTLWNNTLRGTHGWCPRKIVSEDGGNGVTDVLRTNALPAWLR